MSLNSILQDLATRAATESKSLRTLINGNAADLSALSTTDKTNLVAAINEIFASGGGGGAATLDDLTDVIIGGIALATGQVLRYNGTNWVNVLGTTYFEVAGAVAAAASSYQPADSDLTSIAALATTSYGRAFLTLAATANLMALLDAASTSGSGIVELATSAEAITGTDTVRAVTPAALQAKIDALIDGAPGTLDTLNEIAAAINDDASVYATIVTSLAGKQPIDTDLTSIAALNGAADKMLYATGANTWALATLTSFARTLLDDTSASDARTTIDVYSTTQIGSVTTDFVAVFEAGLV